MQARYISALVSLFCVIASSNVGIGDEKTSAKDRVEAAEHEAQAIIDNACLDVRKMLEAKRDVAQKKGDLSEFEKLVNEIQAFDRRNVLPKSVSTRVYERLTQKALNDLERAYQLAVADYTKAGNINAAKAIQEKQEGLKSRQVGRPLDAVRYKGHYYKLYPEKLRWEDARTRCEQMGGNLATIQDQDENALVLLLMEKSSVNQAWLGATDKRRESTWEWVTGEKFGYSNWGPGEPNNQFGTEHFLVLIKSLNGDDLWRGKWSDQPSDSSNQPGFICEWE
ncbi:hypothetical protein GC163_23455 [bacterium]|nr:hypothetical protein [bacterium]